MRSDSVCRISFDLHGKEIGGAEGVELGAGSGHRSTGSRRRSVLGQW